MEAAEAEAWKIALLPGSRTRITNKLTDYLVRHVPVSYPGGRLELLQMATRIEDNIFNKSRTRSEYLRRISLKMLAMESTFCDGPYGTSGYCFNTAPYDEF